MIKMNQVEAILGASTVAMYPSVISIFSSQKKYISQLQYSLLHREDIHLLKEL